MRALLSVIDILLVAFLIYRLLKLVQGRRAWTLLIGIGVFVLCLFLSEKLELRALHWLLEKATILAPVALVILLLPELRAAIEGFARLGLWPERLLATDIEPEAGLVKEVVKAVDAMSRERVGALIVFARTEKLDEVAKSGVPLQAEVSASLLQAIFYEGNPLHDGAAIIGSDRLLAAACRLPLSDSQSLDSTLHMRHRAAVGITEATDAVVVVVSEERGKVSIAEYGEMKTVATAEELTEWLSEALKFKSTTGASAKSVFRRRPRRTPAHPSEEAEQPT